MSRTMSRTHGWLATCLSVAALSLFAHIVHAQQYSLIELDAPATADYTLAIGINDNDQVVGAISFSPASNDPALWNGTIATTLDLAGGIAGAAHAINNAGLIAGTTYTMLPNGSYQQRATVWNGGLATLLPTLGGTQGNAVAINQLGQVVGWTSDTGGWSRAVIWDGPTLTDLGRGTVRDINNVGQMIGLSSSFGPTLWNGTTATALGINMEPIAINDAGAVVGNTYSRDPDTYQYKNTARLWTAGAAVVLTGPANYQFSITACDINNVGQIVGYSENDNLTSVATLWNGTSALNLNTVLTAAQALHIKLTEATAINDLGYIVVNGIDTVAQQRRSYVLVPVPESH
jgi:probable HAF family extracellular repeat protein